MTASPARREPAPESDITGSRANEPSRPVPPAGWNAYDVWRTRVFDAGQKRYNKGRGNP